MKLDLLKLFLSHMLSILADLVKNKSLKLQEIRIQFYSLVRG